MYESLDYRLYWIACRAPQAGSVVICIYKGISGGCRPQLSPPAKVYTFVEHFEGSSRRILETWSSITESGSATRGISTEIFLSVDEGGIGLPSYDGINDFSRALWLDTSRGFILLNSKSELLLNVNEDERLYMRAQFFDDGEGGADHWLGCTGPCGAASLGVARKQGDCYGILQGCCPSSVAESQSGAWKSSGVQRSIGWHFFELVWEDGISRAFIDHEPVSEAPAVSFGEKPGFKITIGAAGGNYGVWAALEVRRTPKGIDKWNLDLAASSISRVPWQACEVLESGSWQFDGTHVLELLRIWPGTFVRVADTKKMLLDSFKPYEGQYCAHPAMDSMLGFPFKVVEVLGDGMVGLVCPEDGVIRYFPPAILSTTEDQPEEDASVEPQEKLTPREVSSDLAQESSAQEVKPAPQDVEPTPVPLEQAPVPLEQAVEDTPIPALQGSTLECWARPDENDAERIERAMGQYSEYFRESGIIVPENIRPVGKCQADHTRCFVYRFGTRKVHLSVREADDGRLTLVIRVGGGFSDFVDFARRHGSLEHRKFVKLSVSDDARITTVFAAKRAAAKAAPGSPAPKSRASSPAPKSRPSPRPSSRIGSKA